MNRYPIDWVGAISAGTTAAIVFFLIKSAFPRLTRVRFSTQLLVC